MRVWVDCRKSMNDAVQMRAALVKAIQEDFLLLDGIIAPRRTYGTKPTLYFPSADVYTSITRLVH